ncbi:MAG: hypothetical protein JWN53_2121 [Gemmatimonadetes bacterium]|jgi:hypothetical protein|nr:hypothetical protein [Gemmatimonadota bacterium]
MRRCRLLSGRWLTRLVVAAAFSYAGSAAEAQHSAGTTRDTSFEALQRRGRIAMGVDQYTSIHRFDDLPTGGRIELQRDSDDPEGVRTIRAHLRAITKAFGTGDFSTPALVHLTSVPGTDVMARKRGVMRYAMRELPRGGVVTITTTDTAALRAVHRFLAFQRGEHQASGHDMHGAAH